MIININLHSNDWRHTKKVWAMAWQLLLKRLIYSTCIQCNIIYYQIVWQNMLIAASSSTTMTLINWRFVGRIFPNIYDFEYNHCIGCDIYHYNQIHWIQYQIYQLLLICHFLVEFRLAFCYKILQCKSFCFNCFLWLIAIIVENCIFHSTYISKITFFMLYLNWTNMAIPNERMTVFLPKISFQGKMSRQKANSVHL